MRKVMAILPCFVGPVWFVLSMLEHQLLKARILNTRDLWPLIGVERGTVSDYLLNVWRWDGPRFLLMVASVPCFCFGLRLLKHPVKS
jgi:hypothetical protein